VGWYPYWYGGLPLRVAYPPLFIYAVAIIHTLSGLSVSHSYRVLVAVAYSTTPAAIYLLAKNLTKRSLASFFAGLAYSFVPEFVKLPFSLAPSLIGTLTLYGEGPHYFGVLLALLALLQLIRTMNNPTWFKCLTASILIASVALSDLVPFFSLTILMIVAVTVEAIYRNDSGIIAFFACFMIAAGLVVFQYDLQFIQLSVQGAGTGAGALNNVALAIPGFLIGIALVRRYFSRYLTSHANSKAWFFVCLWITAIGVLVAPIWIALPQLSPIPSRHVPEFDAGICLLIGLILAKVDTLSLNLRNLPRISFPTPRVVWILGALLILLSINGLFLLPVSLHSTAPISFVSNVPEYRIAMWLSQHVTDESIFASGTAAFWLNVFTDVRQIRGGLDQGGTNTWWNAVRYQILTGADPWISIDWAQAWNVKYIVVTFRNASAYVQDYTYPNKFNGVLPLRYHFGGYGIYEVSLTRSALVEAISTESAEALAPISDIFDTRNLLAYNQLSQVNPNSTATVAYTIPNPDIVQVSVRNATYDTAILVKITYDTRWVAYVNGGAVQTSPIGPDFMVAYPRTTGDYQLTFNLHASDGEILGSYESIATIIVLLIVSADRLRSRRRARRIERKAIKGL
jgi:hypothetical protein